LIQAYRYEELRKIPLISDLMKQHANKLGLQHYNILIVQEVIYNSLCDRYKQMFSVIDLLSINYYMPQDPEARCVYFHILE
jgi:hypothetical protein